MDVPLNTSTKIDARADSLWEMPYPRNLNSSLLWIQTYSFTLCVLKINIVCSVRHHGSLPQRAPLLCSSYHLLTTPVARRRTHWWASQSPSVAPPSIELWVLFKLNLHCFLFRRISLSELDFFQNRRMCCAPGVWLVAIVSTSRPSRHECILKTTVEKAGACQKGQRWEANLVYPH